MRKLILSVAVLATLAVSQAQEKEKTDKVAFGVKVGVNNSSANFAGNPTVSSISSVVGINFGVFTNISLGKKFAFQPELLYSMQGFDYIFDDIYMRSDVKTRLNYINVPLNIQFKVIKKGYIAAGPQIDFLTGAKGDYTTRMKYSGSISSGENIDLKNSYSSTVLGVNIGAGYSITRDIFADIRYCRTLNGANKDNTIDSNNTVLQISVGYKF